MRRVFSLVLLGLSGFLLAVAVLALVVVPGQVRKTPLDVNTQTYLTGQADVLPDGSSSPVKALSHTVADGKASSGSVVVFNTFTCVIKDPDGTAPDCVDAQDSQDRLVTASTDRFATDRTRAEAVNDAKYVGADARPHEGLVNKFPFGTQKKTYRFWDGLLGRAVDAEYKGAEKVGSIDTYKYVISFTDEPAQIASGVQGTYSDEKTLWADTVTGSIVKQQEHQVRRLPSGATALDLDLAFTQATVDKNVKDASDNRSQLSLLGKPPLVAGLLGLLGLAGGLVLLRGSREGVDVPTGTPTSRSARYETA